MNFRTNTKKLLAGALAAGLLALQFPAAAFAATDTQSGWGAKRGLDFLASQQLATGEIPSALGGDSDWATIAIQATGGDAFTFKKDGGVSIAEHLQTEAVNDATDVARRMLAIAALGADTTDFGGVDYGQLLASYADGEDKEIGDDTFLNDETFAIMAIAASGNQSLYQLAEDSLALLLTNQNTDPDSPDFGSFSGGTCAFCVPNSNDTATAIIAIEAAQSKLGLTDEALETAKENAIAYLLSTQQEDGGFIYSPLFGGPADTTSTAWALMALNTIGADVEAQAARGWLLARQNADGGFDGWMCGASDVSATVHIITALVGTTWLLEPAASITIPDTEPAELIARDECPVVVPSTPPETSEPAPTPETPAPIVPASTPTNTTDEPQTLAAETTPEEPTDVEEDNQEDEVIPVAETGSSAAKYILYTLVALSLITIGWRLLQPKKS